MGQELRPILIADDDDLVREELDSRLSEEMPGVTIDIVFDGVALIKKACDTTYGLIVTDYRTPGMDGITAVREIRKYQPSTPIIVMSSDNVRDRALAAGSTAFVKKINPDELIDKCHELYRGG